MTVSRAVETAQGSLPMGGGCCGGGGGGAFVGSTDWCLTALTLTSPDKSGQGAPLCKDNSAETAGNAVFEKAPEQPMGFHGPAPLCRSSALVFSLCRLKHHRRTGLDVMASCAVPAHAPLAFHPGAFPLCRAVAANERKTSASISHHVQGTVVQSGITC